MSNTRDMKRITLYLDVNLLKQVSNLAAKDRRSLSFMVGEILEKAVSRKNAKKGSI